MNVGICADVGVLQRIQRIVGNGSVISEWAMTGRKFDSKEARSEGLVSRVLKDKDELIDASLQLAKVIASQSPVAVQGTKVRANRLIARVTASIADRLALWCGLS